VLTDRLLLKRSKKVGRRLKTHLAGAAVLLSWSIHCVVAGQSQWVQIGGPETSDLEVRALAYHPPTPGFPQWVLLAGTIGEGVLRSTDFGESWTEVNSGLEPAGGLDVMAMAFGLDGTLYAGLGYEFDSRTLPDEGYRGLFYSPAGAFGDT